MIAHLSKPTEHAAETVNYKLQAVSINISSSIIINVLIPDSNSRGIHGLVQVMGYVGTELEFSVLSVHFFGKPKNKLIF